MGRPLTSKYSVELKFSFDKWLGDNLSFWRNAVLNQDIDFFIIVDGKEGSGKSVHAIQIAYFLDVDRRIDPEKQVCFTPQQVKEAINSLKPGKAIIYDEAKRGLNRRRSTENTNIELTELFAECRQNNLFLVVVLPAFHDLDMNVAVHRTRALVHVYYKWDTSNKERPLLRGFARFYNEEAKKHIYCNKATRQMYKHPRHKDSFDYRFPHFYCIDEELYRKKKKEAVLHFTKKKEAKGRPICEVCGSTDTRYRSTKKNWVCKSCGWVRESVSADIRKKTEV